MRILHVIAWREFSDFDLFCTRNNRRQKNKKIQYFWANEQGPIRIVRSPLTLAAGGGSQATSGAAAEHNHKIRIPL